MVFSGLPQAEAAEPGSGAHPGSGACPRRPAALGLDQPRRWGSCGSRGIGSWVCAVLEPGRGVLSRAQRPARGGGTGAPPHPYSLGPGSAFSETAGNS